MATKKRAAEVVKKKASNVSLKSIQEKRRRKVRYMGNRGNIS